MKKLHLYTAGITIGLIFIISSAFTADRQEEMKSANSELIKFSHSLHAEMMDCADCHMDAAEATSLNAMLIPGKPVCADCHDVEDDDNCELCHYEDVFEPLEQPESELIFNHKFHFVDQELACTECHKGFDEIDYGFEAEQGNPPMIQCYSCHNPVGVALNECEVCHQETGNGLVPEDHKTALFMEEHKFSAMSSEADCQMCHDNETCESCHVGTTMITDANTNSDFWTPYSPHKFLNNNAKQKINTVHDFNYRFTHGIDARSKAMECQTCHETQTFCAECHNTTGDGGDYAAGGFVPLSHTQPNFTTFGYGSGGGQHAVFARRDIESCQSCHDTQGADPNCIMCHSDPDGIQMTDARVHPVNFRIDENGDWHTDQGSVCYNCHTDANAQPGGNPNIGFCGYCHAN